jgi:hypothetical protein
VHAVTIEVVVVDFVSAQHETMQTHVVDKHFLELDTLLSHILVIDYLVWCFRVPRGIQLCFDD